MPRLNELLGQQQPGTGAVPAEFAADAGRPPATLDPPPSQSNACPLCSGFGFVRQDVPADHPEFGRAVPCRCVETESRDVKLARLQHYSNLGPLMRLTFENLSRFGHSSDPRRRDRYERCVADARAFAEETDGWLTIVGTSGCGKTHIAAAVANRCLERGVPALFVVVPDLLDHLRAAYKPDAEVSYDQLFEQVRSAPVLILDDLGTQSATPWAQEKLFQIINHRFNARLPMIVTSNVPLRRMEERFRSRLTDVGLSKVYEIEEKNVLDDHKLNIVHQPRIRSMSFHNFDSSGRDLPAREAESLQAAYAGCLSFAQEPDGWVVLTGKPGSGKTHLAAAIANHCLQRGQNVKFVKASRLLQHYRSTLDGSTDSKMSEIEEEIESAPLLVLDDLFFRPSSAYKSEWANERLFSLVDHRYENRLNTVFTTAITEAAMTADEIGNRFAVRIWDFSVSAEFQITAGAYKQPRKAAAAQKPKPR